MKDTLVTEGSNTVSANVAPTVASNSSACLASMVSIMCKTLQCAADFDRIYAHEEIEL